MITAVRLHRDGLGRAPGGADSRLRRAIPFASEALSAGYLRFAAWHLGQERLGGFASSSAGMRKGAFFYLTLRFGSSKVSAHHKTIHYEGKRMKTEIAVPIPTDQFLDLVEFLRSKDDPRDPVEVVSIAIMYWMDNADWKPELLVESDARGYQWKNVFLPEGTQIRMQYQSAYSYAKVEGDDLTYQGSPISPGSLAKTIAGGYNRNAWRDLWIKRPEDKEWILADELRAQSKDALKKLIQELRQPSSSDKTDQDSQN